MGAWFVMSSMGFFEMNGGTSPDLRVDLTAPLFDKIINELDTREYAGKECNNEDRNNSKEKVYIQSVKLNGKEINKPYISFPDIVNGGKLEFEMGAEPNEKWGRADYEQ